MAGAGTDGDGKRAGGDTSLSAAARHESFPRFPFAGKGLKGMIVSGTAVKVLLLLTLAGLLLRFWHIGDVSFWFDEVVTNSIAHRTVPEIWNAGMYDHNPPAFYWIEHFMLYFGSGETVLRFIPALAGMCTIPVFYLLGKEFHNRTTGILAAALLTFSAFHINYSQEARPYTLLLFLFSLALLFYLRAGRTNDPGTWLLSGLFSALACWSHFFGFVMVLPLVLMACITGYRSGTTLHKDLRPVLRAGAAWFLLSLPMMIYFVCAGFLQPPEGSWGLKDIHVITSVLWFQLGQNYLAVILLFIVFLLGLFRLFRDERDRFFFIVTAMGLPVLTAVIATFRTSIATQHLICLLPFFFLVTGYCISSSDRRVCTVRLSCIAVLMMVAISAPSLFWYYSSDTKNGENWRDLATELQKQAGAGDVILVHKPFYTAALAYYYHNETEQTFVYGFENRTRLETLVMQNPARRKILISVGNMTGSRSPGIGPWAKDHAALLEQRQQLYIYRVV